MVLSDLMLFVPLEYRRYPVSSLDEIRWEAGVARSVHHL